MMGIPKEHNEIINLHKSYNGCSTEAAKHSDYKPEKLRRAWKKYNLSTGKQGLRADGRYSWAINQETENEIIKLRKKDYQIREIAKILELSKQTIIKYLRKNDFPAMKHGGDRRSLEFKSREDKKEKKKANLCNLLIK